MYRNIAEDKRKTTLLIHVYMNLLQSELTLHITVYASR